MAYKSIVRVKVFYFYLITLSLFSNYLRAEISLDSINDTKTIINNKNLKNCTIDNCNIYGGYKSGKNLFHKFNRFNTSGKIKEVKFFNGEQRNIIVGVSSKNGTFLNKPIKLERQGNLFWVSPNGLRIEKGAEFINAKNLSFSTADSLRFSKNIFNVFEDNKFHLKKYNSDPSFGINSSNELKNLNSGDLNFKNINILGANILVKKKFILDAPNGSVDLKDTKIKTTAKNNSEITITGSSILLRGDTKLISSGDESGGLIQVGGSWQNSNKEVRQSNSTIVEDKVLIDASSRNGQGGTIVIWSDIKNKGGLTKVKGRIISNGNKAGNIETSGANLDVKDIKISLKSKQDDDGIWLLDPFNFEINETNKVSIEDALNNGSNVIITTSNNLDFDLSPNENQITFFNNYSDDRQIENGDITIRSTLDFSKGQGSLKLIADDQIKVDSNITTGVGGLFISAPGGLTGEGAISINPLNYNFNGNNTNKLTNYFSITQNVNSQYNGQISGNNSSNLYKNGSGQLSLSLNLKNFENPIIGSNAGKIISLADKATESLGGIEFKPPQIIIVKPVVVVSTPTNVSSSGGGGGGRVAMSPGGASDSGSGSGSSSNSSVSSSTDSSSSSGGESSSSSSSSSEGDSGSSSDSSSSSDESSSSESSSDESSSDESSSDESSSDESSSDESSSDESSSDESSSDESSSDEESEKGTANQSNKNIASSGKKNTQKIQISASQALAGISNIYNLQRKSLIDNLNKSELRSSERAINSLNLATSIQKKAKSTIDLQQSIIRAKEQVRSKNLITKSFNKNNLISYLGSSKLNEADLVFQNKKYNPAIMHIRFTQSKGKTIDKNADAFLDLTVISSSGNLSGKRIELTTKKFAKNLRALYSQLSRQEDLDVDNESSPSRILYEILFKSVEEELDKDEITTLLISADRGLQAVPFAALHDGNKYFGEKYAFAITPSLSLTNLDFSDKKDKKILAIGASQFEELAPLPLVNQELKNISNPINKDIVLNKEFTPETFFEKAIQDKYDKIHLATHAEFKPGGPESSQLFSGTNPISLDKFSILRKGRLDNPLELIVLSACRTAVGDQDTELGFSGLALQAGSKSAVGTLWYVDDVMTSAYFVQMYSFLDMGIPKAEAMQMTRKAFIQEKIKLEKDSLIGINNQILLSNLNNSQKRIIRNGLNNPFFWAGIELMGSPW